MEVREETIKQWDYGVFKPTITQIAKASDYLGVSTDFLLKGTD